MKKLDMRREVLSALKCESVRSEYQAETYAKIRDRTERGEPTTWTLSAAKSKATVSRNRVKALLVLRREFIEFYDKHHPYRRKGPIHLTTAHRRRRHKGPVYLPTTHERLYNKRHRR